MFQQNREGYVPAVYGAIPIQQGLSMDTELIKRVNGGRRGKLGGGARAIMHHARAA